MLSFIAQTLLLFLFSFPIASGTHCTDSTGTKCDFCLEQEYFAEGTYRITQPGLHCVTEDIRFNPVAGNVSSPNAWGAWFPTANDTYPACRDNAGGAFALGFFAAISVEVSSVRLDLNGHTVAQHPHFYTQQRWASIIEIASSPFLPGVGPGDFGDAFESVSDIEIYNGRLGLSSHHSVHSNNASNVHLHDLVMADFEVAAVHLNGFKGAVLENLVIGPSSTVVNVSARYSNARFALLSLRHLIDDGLGGEALSFAHSAGGTTLQGVHDRLVAVMDIAFRHATGTSTADDLADPLYAEARSLFGNEDGLPDGSAVYGIVLNSFSVAILGFGASKNSAARHGEQATLRNITIRDLTLAVEPVPAVYLDECDGNYGAARALKGPFGDMLDVRQMVGAAHAGYIDNYDRIQWSQPQALSELRYEGNALSDAQLALFVLRSSAVDWSFTAFVHDEFLAWAMDGDEWPACARFVCNGDNMFHTNKGVIGVRMDGIEDAVMEGVAMSGLENRSPLATSACANYSGAHDGGSPGFIDEEGALDTDVRGLSVCDGDLLLLGGNAVAQLHSWWGDVVAVDLLADALLEFEELNGTVGALTVDGSTLRGSTRMTQAKYEELFDDSKTPHPFTFKSCQLSVADETVSVVGAPAQWSAGGDCQASWQIYPKRIGGVCYCQSGEGRGPCWQVDIGETTQLEEVRVIWSGEGEVQVAFENRYGRELCQANGVQMGGEAACSAEGMLLSELPEELVVSVQGDQQCKAVFAAASMAVDSNGDGGCGDDIVVSGIETSEAWCDDGYEACSCEEAGLGAVIVEEEEATEGDDDETEQESGDDVEVVGQEEEEEEGQVEAAPEAGGAVGGSGSTSTGSVEVKRSTLVIAGVFAVVVLLCVCGFGVALCVVQTRIRKRLRRQDELLGQESRPLVGFTSD